jgi:hypothetical protein
MNLRAGALKNKKPAAVYFSNRFSKIPFHALRNFEAVLENRTRTPPKPLQI